MISICQARGFDRLLGQVDVQIMSKDGAESLLSAPELVSSCICEMKPIREDKLQMINILCESR